MCMIGFAGFIDFVQFLLDIAFIGFILDSVISVIAGIMFGIWFSSVGMSMMNPDRALGFIGTFLIELIPGFDALPVWTLKIGQTVISEWRSPEEI